VAEAQDIVHQIEYRWHDRLDLSPHAFSMSQESLRGWDTWIRDWVRHPHVDGLWESLCYQIQPNGRAAVAWRYEDWQAAERDDGTRGRPLVSRVLAAQANLLTPEVAIVLCRTGLPTAAGPRPGQVTAETELPAIRADELSALVSERAARLDQEAARQEGLRQVVASALSDQHAPLAIHVRGSYILKPPGEGMQCPLLWGLRRIVWPLVGTAGRGWSFSTFEPPQGGEVDPATLPDILFRQTQDTPPAAPARPRKEIKSRPFDPSTLDDKSTLAQLAGWLVAEYQERGGDELRKVIADWCGTEHSVQPRIQKVYEELRARHSPIVISGSPAPFVSVSTVQAPEHEPDLLLEPAESRRSALFAADEPAPAEPDSAELAEGPPVEAEATASPPIPAPARDQGRPEQPAVAPEQPAVAPDEPVTTRDQQVHGQQVGASQAADEDRSGDEGWFEDEDQPQSDYTWPPASGLSGDTAEHGSDPRESQLEEDLADPEHTPDRAYLTDPQHRGDLPYRETPPEPQVSSQPAARDRPIPTYPERTWAARRDSSPGQFQREGKPPELATRSQRSRSRADENQQGRGRPPAAINDLLKQLPAAADTQEFKAILQSILRSDSQPDTADRVKARREVSKSGWYENIHERFDKLLWVEELTRIFYIIVIPDLEDPTVAKKIGEWAEHAHPAIIAGLLRAARMFDDDTWHSMMQILQPKLAYRWTIKHGMQVLWDPSLATHSPGDSGRSRFSFFRKN
jgi:hypothetical protein